MYCTCDNCLAGNNDNCEWHFPFPDEDYEDYPRCPGFKTELHYHQCGAEVDNYGDICCGCEILRDEAERMVEEAVERAHQRQLQSEEQQLMRQYGDCDGDKTIPDEDLY